MKPFLLFIIIFYANLGFAQQSNCWDYRDDSGLKVCVNDRVMVISDSAAQMLRGPFKVIGLEGEGVVDLEYITTLGKPGFRRKAIAELDVIVLENRHFSSKVKIGDRIIRTHDLKTFEVIGLGADDTIGIKIGPNLNEYLWADEYKKLP